LVAELVAESFLVLRFSLVLLSVAEEVVALVVVVDAGFGSAVALFAGSDELVEALASLS